MKKKLPLILWLVFILCGAGALFSRVLFNGMDWPRYVFLTVMVLVTGLIIRESNIQVSKRSATLGAHSLLTTILVFGIVGILNFLSYKHPYKWDLTQNKLNSFSEQTRKIVRELPQDTAFTYFYSDPAELEKIKGLLQDYRDLSPKLTVEYLQIERNLERAKQAGIKSPNSVVIKYGEREKRIDSPTEETLTNALINLQKSKKQILCTSSGHGERDMAGADAEGYSSAKKTLEDEGYEIKEWKAAQSMPVPEDCAVLAVLGPKSAFFKPEIDALDAYLQKGGRAFFALDVNLKGTEPSPSLVHYLKAWNIEVAHVLTIDTNPLNRMMGQSVALSLVAEFSSDSKITSVFFQPGQAQLKYLGHFPFSRSLTEVPNATNGVKVKWLAKTMATSWAETDLKGVGQGSAKFDQGQDKKGPITVAMSAEKNLDEKAGTAAKLVVFGTSHFGNNQFSRFGVNSDLFINSLSWLAGEDAFIAIRKKTDDPGKIEMSQEASIIISWLAIVIIPLAVAIGGIIVWVRRKRL